MSKHSLRARSAPHHTARAMACATSDAPCQPALARRPGAWLYLLLLGALARPELAFASTLRTQQARQHFGWLEQLAQMATGVVPLLSMLAIVGGLIMWGIGGGSEGVMKKIGPVVAAFGVAGFILTSGSFLGIGSAVI